ncbi:ABC transporter permease subunit [Ectobacillus polymachus]|uniref:ABC transporter permease subunit n=1 Tax=Ectobacillus polymachus TaxID=1508806 RepID=UPI003A83A639
MNVFMREMKANRKSLFLWSIGMILLIAASMGKYAGFSSTAGSMKDVIAQMPKALQDMMSLGGFDLSKVSGYYGVLFIYIVLMAAIHAAIIGAAIISKEERDKTAEFLFVKPVSRNSILTAKLAVAFVHILILNLITYLSSLLFVSYFSKGEAVSGDITKLMVGMFIIQLIFLWIGASVAVSSPHPQSATAISTGILLGTFVLSRAIEINSNLTFLQYLSPFQYFRAIDLMYGGSFQPVFIVCSVIIIGLLGVFTYMYNQKRDLHV